MVQTRAAALDGLRTGEIWDVLVIGGGATGLGCAVDAAARGCRTLLVERGDYACGTSSRSTKLIHGGVRYLRQGELALVRHALQERARLLRNAPHLVHPLSFVIPAQRIRDQFFFASGLKLYDLLAGAANLAPSHWLSRQQTLAALPGCRAEGLCGGVQYWDAQFDDARLAITLMRTATDLGATCLNYLSVIRLLKAGGKVCGAVLRDAESGEEFEVQARAVINATGVYADAVRHFDEPAAAPMLTHSQGIHLVVDADFLPGKTALLIPETEDGRVMFAIPWLGKVLLGTTDTERADLPDEPQPLAGEVDFLLRTAAGVLARPPQREDVRSVFAGLRPLLNPQHASGQQGTATLSREHVVLVGESGLITVAGGKWTTYRWMAEQVVNRALAVAGLPAEACSTHDLLLHGGRAGNGSGVYGSDAQLLAELPGHGIKLHASLPCTEAMVRFAIRHEGARNIEDILARRTRALFLDAEAAGAMIARVGEIVAEELQLTPQDLAAMLGAAGASADRFHLR
jgi:glycerol-3-phosphate dehydrogenase